MTNSHNKAVPEEGALEGIGVPLILAHAWRDRRSGCLQLSQGKNERRVQIRDGAPVAIDTNRGEDTLAAFLADTRQIDDEGRIEVERMAAEKACPQASAVLALKLLDARALYLALRAVARIQIAETFDWRAGHYRWKPASSNEHAGAKALDILSLFQEQLPRRWGTDRLFEELMSVQEVHGDISPRFQKVARKLAQAGKHAERAIRRLDGSMPIGRILGDCAGDPVAAATLWTVYHAGILRVSENDVTEAQPATLDFEVHVEVDPNFSPSEDSGVPANTATARTADSEERADALRSEIESLLGQLARVDHYAALGLDESANAVDIKKAYFKSAKKYHPDGLARLGLGDLKEDAARVFARIAEAFETLSNRDKRAQYDSHGSQELQIDTARLAQAETSFRKGEILSKMGNFLGALEYLTPAAELWPDEPAYQSGLGWALYKQPKADLPRATKHLEIALSQAPKDAVIHFRLGMVLRASGENARAAELIATARSIQPDVRD